MERNRVVTTTVTVELSEEEMEEILRKALNLEGNVRFQVKELDGAWGDALTKTVIVWATKNG
jgi:hypothetical protein